MNTAEKQPKFNYCFIYARVSTVRQAQEGYSIDAQIQLCKEFANKLKFKVKHVFADRGESGTALDRPQFQEMLNRCEEKEVSAVIVFHIDRLARNEYDFFFIKGKFEKLGIRILSVSQPSSVENTPESHLIEGIMANVSAYYSRDNSRKTKKGMRRKFDEGWYPSWAPLGYVNIRDEATKKSIIIQDIKSASLVKKAFELYVTGDYSLTSLCKELNTLGLRGKLGGKISESTLQQILTNPFYYGLMRWSGMEKMGKHKPLITKELFNRIQHILASHRDFIIRQRKYNFLLRGVVWCEIHNRRLVAEWHFVNSNKHKKVGYYHCTNRGGCKGSYVKIEELESKVANLLKKVQFKQKFIDLILNKAKEYLNNISKNAKANKKMFQNQIKSLEAKRDKLENLLLREEISPEVFNRLYSKVESQISSIYYQIVDIEKDRSINIDFLKAILSFTRDIYNTYLKAPTFLKRRYLKLFINKVYIRDKDISYVEYQPLFKTLIKEQKVILRQNWLRR